MTKNSNQNCKAQKDRKLINIRASFLLILFLPFALSAQKADLIINEIMALNGSIITDEDGDYSDWIEIYNAGTGTVSLLNWTLSDNSEIPDKWTFPDVSIPANGYLLVFASGKNRALAGQELHTIFRLDAAGEYLGLFDPEGLAATKFDPYYPVQKDDHSFGRLNDLYIEFSIPTPGKENGEEGGILASPVFDISHGLFDAPFDLTISKEAESVRVYYTTDGDVPDSVNGILYTAPLNITTTSVLRAIAVSPEGVTSRVSTQSYIFPADVIHQPNNPEGYPVNLGPYSNLPGLAIADYEMDPEMMADPVFAEKVISALRALPTLSLVTNKDHFFSHSTHPDTGGIYIYPAPGDNDLGRGWERPVSFEFFNTHDSNSVQIDCGIQLQGGASRNPEKSPKHSFRVVFRGEYGASKLIFPLFKDENASQRFDNLVLRAGFNQTWHHWGDDQRVKAQYVRDIWNKDTQRAMGHPSSQSEYSHLYINGIYWGIYSPSERMDSDFGANYMGGESEEYDVIKDYTEIADGNDIAWKKMMAMVNAGTQSDEVYQKLQGNNPDGSYNPNLECMLDVVSLADYMLLNFYGGNTDWDHHNWASMRNRVKPEGFRFLQWDAEHTLKSLSENVTGEKNSGCPSYIYQELTENSEFKRMFADRVQKYCQNGGLLTPEPVAQRWTTRKEVVESGIDAEVSRWGDYRRDVHPYRSGPYDLYTKETHWVAEQEFLYGSYFPQRTDILIDQLRAKDMFPNVDAPQLLINNVFINGNVIEPGDELKMFSEQGDVYYTTNGSDPARWEEGKLNTIVELGATKRVIVPKSDIGSSWASDLNFNDSNWQLCEGGPGGIGYDTRPDYLDMITLDVGADMSSSGTNPNTSCYVRIPFKMEAADLAEGKQIYLRVWYDDGFAAILNGTKVAVANAPGTLSWNSASTDGNEATDPTVINLTSLGNFLKEGDNLLAIQAMNEKTSSSDFLIMAEIISGGSEAANISEDAIKYSGSITLNESSHFRARTLYNGEWSATSEKFFVVPEDYQDIKITEIHYHPLGKDTVNDRYFEFVELKNIGSSALDLGGVSFIDGIRYSFPYETRLGPGEFVVLASDRDQFYQRYGFLPLDEFDGQLNNAGELMILVGPAKDTLLMFFYGTDGSWPVEPDGLGNSLVPTEFNPAHNQQHPMDWRASHFIDGSPNDDDRLNLQAEEIKAVTIAQPELKQNFPNPFSDQTHIQFTLPDDAFVRVSVINMMGQEVHVLTQENKTPGTHSLTWQGVDRSGNLVPDGFYFYRMIVKSDSGPIVITRKMLLMR